MEHDVAEARAATVRVETWPYFTRSLTPAEREARKAEREQRRVAREARKAARLAPEIERIRQREVEPLRAEIVVLRRALANARPIPTPMSRIEARPVMYQSCEGQEAFNARDAAIIGACDLSTLYWAMRVGAIPYRLGRDRSPRFRVVDILGLRLELYAGAD